VIDQDTVCRSTSVRCSCAHFFSPILPTMLNPNFGIKRNPPRSRQKSPPDAVAITPGLPLSYLTCQLAEMWRRWINNKFEFFAGSRRRQRPPLRSADLHAAHNGKYR